VSSGGAFETIAARFDPARREEEAHALAARVPALLVEAQRVAHTVSHGVHGRRRAGPGETFWQFRHFENTDSQSGIDWRRSASSDHLFVREREWEAAHTVWLWVDQSPSMMFRSKLSETMKGDRALVLGLAISELLARGGERVGLIGSAPVSGRYAVRRLAEHVAREGAGEDSLPPAAPLSRWSACLLFSDFLEPVPETAARLQALAGQGVRGHLVQIMDPAEETLPYDGRTEFAASEGGMRYIAGRAEALRDKYRARLAAHRDALREETRRLGWSFLLHHTDRPAEEALLALHNRLAGLETDYRFRASQESAASESREGATT
jgi:uncharacterized protein (DUF58 family)